MRTGLIAQKQGMSRIFDAEGRHIPVTVLKVESCQVVAQRTEEKDGYTALQPGAGTRKAKKVSKANRGHFAKAKVEAKAKVAEFQLIVLSITITHFQNVLVLTNSNAKSLNIGRLGVFWPTLSRTRLINGGNDPAA